MRNRKFLAISFLTLTICCIYSCSDERVPETFLIDKDFRGDFYIIYNQKGAQKEKFEGDARVYKIPKTGVLFTEFEPDWRGMTYHNGRTSQRFYLVDEHGTRKEVTELDIHKFEGEAPINPKMDSFARDSVVAFFIAAGGLGPYTCDSYYIGTYDHFGKCELLNPEYIDSLKTLLTNK